MTYPEYEAKIREIVANPDNIAAASVDLLAEIKKDTETLDSVHAQHQAAQTKIRELQDTNYKLFLRVTGQPDAAGAEDDHPEQAFDNAISEIFQKEDK